MSEQPKHYPETSESFKPAHEAQESPRERAAVEQHDPTDQDPLTESLNAIRAAVETQAVSGEETPRAAGNESASQAQAFTLQRSLKADAYRQTLKRTSSKLPTPSRIFSRVIHQPAIEAVSNAGAKTVARPSGLLTGSILALLGTSFVLYMTKHAGFTYNYTVFAATFVGGFAIGLLIEAVWRLAFRRRSH